MLSSMVRSLRRPIHIALTRELLVIYVDLDRLPRELYIRSSLAGSVIKYLKFCDVQYPKRKKRLVVYLGATKDSRNSNGRLFLVMRREATSLDWTVEKYRSLEKMYQRRNILQCLATSRMEKQ